MTTEYKFWMIFAADGAREEEWPITQHFSKDDAMDKLNRLAERNPGKRYYLLESIGVAQTSRPVIMFQNIIETTPAPAADPLPAPPAHRSEPFLPACPPLWPTPPDVQPKASMEQDSVIHDLKDKWDRDGVDKMNDEEYGKWLANQAPADLAALMLMHNNEMEAAEKDRLETLIHEQETGITALPTGADAQDESDLAAEYAKIAAAAAAHKKRQKTFGGRMCPACHDTGIVPDPENPEDTIMCQKC